MQLIFAGKTHVVVPAVIRIMRVRSRLSCAVQRRTAHNGASSELLTPTMAGRVRTELTSCAVWQPVNRRLELVWRVGFAPTDGLAGGSWDLNVWPIHACNFVF